MTVNANLLRRPHAADDIARLTMGLAGGGSPSDTPRLKRKWFFSLYTGHKPAHTR